MNETTPTIIIDSTLKCNICSHVQEISICRTCKNYSPGNTINNFPDMFEKSTKTTDEFKIATDKFFAIKEIKNVGIEVLLKPDKTKDEIVKFNITITEGLIFMLHLHQILKKYKFKMQEE